MAIQMRRGEYDDFDASKMLAGELAVVVSGDPETEGGALYVATAAGSATRVAFANEIPGDATTTSDGLMSAADKSKLDGIAEGANKVTITEGTRGSGAKVVSFTVQNPDGTFEFPPSAVKADSNGYVDMTSVANGSIPNSKLATPYTLPTMSASAKGGATVGDGLAMTGDALGIADEGVDMGMLSQEVQDAIAEGGSGSGYNPSLSVGRADALTGADSTAQWATRTSTGSGAATVRSVQGAAAAWNQLIESLHPSDTNNGVTFTNNGDGTWTVDGTATANAHKVVHFITTSIIELTLGHTYLYKGCPSGGSLSTYCMRDAYNAHATDVGNGVIFTYSTGDTRFQPDLFVAAGTTVSSIVFIPQLFDLTQMFGVGNEPQTVAEFERMYPEPYYPYSKPTLKPVQIAGICSVGFNQWDEEWEQGYLNVTSGAPSPATNVIRSKNYCRIIPDQTYYLTCSRDDGGSQNRFYAAMFFYDEEKAFVSHRYCNRQTFTVPSNAAYFKLCTNTSTVVYGGTYTHDICVNLSDPALNGTYKPYMTDSVEWTAQTLRAAGSVRDELTADELVTRVGVVDLGTLGWRAYTTGGGKSLFLAALATSANYTGGQATPNAKCADYETVSLGNVGSLTTDKVFSLGSYYETGPNVYVSDSAYTDAASFKAAMNGVLLYYELAESTTTPISPALPMTYKVQQGGSESIIVPEGEVSAAPIITVAEGESAADVVMDALACIATPDGPVATANHAINTYLTMQGKLYKVTSAIAVGETIKSGTNVSQTTVMAELIARTA